MTPYADTGMKSMSDTELKREILRAFDIRDLSPPSTERLESLMGQVRDGRPLDSIHDGLDTFILNQAQSRVANARWRRERGDTE